MSENGNENNKLPPWGVAILMLWFFGMTAMIIVGDRFDLPALRATGIVSLFVGMALAIVIINIVTRARRAKGGDDGSLDEYMRNQETMYRANKLADKTPRTTVDEVMVREDLLHLAFERKKRDDLADEYDAAADVYWQKYAGDTWDENVAAIDALIDEYYAKMNGDGEPAETTDEHEAASDSACDVDDGKPNVFSELFAREKPEETVVTPVAPITPDAADSTIKQQSDAAATPTAQVAADGAHAQSADTAFAPTAQSSVTHSGAPADGDTQTAPAESGNAKARTKSARIGYKRIEKK